MTEQASSGAAFELRSAYDPASRSISLKLTVGGGGLPAHARLALTSVIQLTPVSGEALRLVRRLASYHEFAIDNGPLAPGAEWHLGGLTPSHRPRHSNDGPVSAFVILPDESTVPVVVVSMRRIGDPAYSVQPTDAIKSASSPTAPAIVPFPTSVEIADETPITTTTAYLMGDHPVARQDTSGGDVRQGRFGGEAGGWADRRSGFHFDRGLACGGFADRGLSDLLSHGLS